MAQSVHVPIAQNKKDIVDSRLKLLQCTREVKVVTVKVFQSVVVAYDKFYIAHACGA